MKEKFNAYRPAAAAFLTMMAMSLTSSTLSFFLEPVCAHLNISRSSFSLIFSLMSVSGILLNPAMGQFAGKRGVRPILVLGGLWSGVCLALLSVVKSAGMLHLISFCMGIFSSTCLALCANVIVQRAYSGAKASGILGGVMAGSGVGGMIFGLVIPGCIAQYGWQRGMLVMALCWTGLLWLAALLLGKERKAAAETGEAEEQQGMTRAEALKSPKLYLQMGLIIIITACCGVQQQLPSLLAANGFDAGTVSWMVSGMTGCIAVGKIVQGLLYGKFGIRWGGCWLLAGFAAGCLGMLSPALAYPGLVLLAFGMGIYTTLLPQVARQTFGSREYAAIWALIATAGNVGTIVANPLWGMVYDVTGNYSLGLIVSAILLMAGVGVLMWTLRENGKSEK